MKILSPILMVLTCILAMRGIWKLDLYDRMHPFGLDNIKNKKYTPDVKGEEYGVHVYKGIPSNKDKISSMLNKIEWLSESYKRDVSWRLSLCFGILGSLILLTMIDIKYFSEPRILLTCVIVCSGIVYFFKSYRNHHVEFYKSFYIRKHVKKIKKQLKLKLDNKLLD